MKASFGCNDTYSFTPEGWPKKKAITPELSPTARLQVGSKKITASDDPTALIEVNLWGVGDDNGDLTLYLPKSQAEKLKLGSKYRVKLVPVSS